MNFGMPFDVTMKKNKMQFLTLCAFTFRAAVLATLLMLGNSLYAQQNVTGKWILANIDSKDTILVQDSYESLMPISSEKVKEKPAMVHKIALKDYMKKDLHPGITKFVFGNGTFEFYRMETITYSGTFTIKGSALSLFRPTTKNSKPKISKIVLLNEKQLILESESNGKPLTLTFSKL